MTKDAISPTLYILPERHNSESCVPEKREKGRKGEMSIQLIIWEVLPWETVLSGKFYLGKVFYEKGL